jgi:hypothetical protein
MAAALTRALAELGVTVESELTDVTTEEDGKEGYRLELRQSARVAPVEVRGARVVHRCTDPSDGSVRAWVAVPEVEWLELARLLRGRTLLAIECAGVAAESCDSEQAMVLLRAAAADLELGLLPEHQRVDETTGSARLCELGVKAGAARVLHVSFGARDDGEDYGEHFAWATARAQILETRDCKVWRSAAPAETKGAQFSAAEARKTALFGAVQRLVDEMRGW